MILPWRVFTFIVLGLVSAVRVNGTDDGSTACVRAAQNHLPLDLAVRLCLHAPEDVDVGPAQCAAAALRSRSFAGSSAEVVNDVVELCESARDSQPAECWTTAMASQSSRTSGFRKAAVTICKSTNSSLPAQCLLEFKRHGLTMTESSAAATNTVIGICKDFHGHISAIGACLARAPRSLSDVLRYELCRHGNASTVPEVVECAKQLLQRITRPELVVRACALAAALPDQPQVCVLAAQQQLRWMEAEAVAHLCEHSQATAAPVHCATQLRSWFIAEFSRDHSLLDLARLCHKTLDADAVVRCVKTLPHHLFQAGHVVQLCGPSVTESSSEKVECVVRARQQLFGLSTRYLDENTKIRDEQASLLLTLCQDVNTTASPLECVVSTATHNPPFSPHERVRLCEDATSSAPHQCFRSIQSSLLARFPGQTADGIELCRAATSIAPAACVNQLLRASSAFFQSGSALELCEQAVSAAPAQCYAAAPHDFTDHDKTVLCARAESDAPAACAKAYLPRVSRTAMKAELCARAVSTGPVRCATASPFGMSAGEIVHLCHDAMHDIPAQCARAVPPHLRIPWRDIAAVCHGAESTTPGSCLAHRVRHRVALTQRTTAECRSMGATASTIEIVQFAYECPELLPRCPIILKARVLDQFGDDMPPLSHGFIQLVVIPDSEEERTEPVLRGVTVAPIVNGSALFRELFFSVAGNFTLRLSATGVEDMIARLQVRTNETERAERERCDRLFSLMQCSRPQPIATDPSSVSLQILELPNQWALSALSCESLWSDERAGLKPLGVISHDTLYALPRTAYQLLTGHNVPTASMTSWECLGIPEGSNRSTIRRAYHKRSLEWHPDKWATVHSSVLSTTQLRSKVEEVYARINAAYQQLFDREAMRS